MVGRKVRTCHLVLGVREPRDRRDDLIDEVGTDYRELGLNADPVQDRLVPGGGVMDRGGGLAAVDDLKILYGGQAEAAIWKVHEADVGSGRGDPIVVGKEPVGPVEDGVPDALVDRASRLEE